MRIFIFRRRRHEISRQLSAEESDEFIDEMRSHGCDIEDMEKTPDPQHKVPR